MQSKQLCHPSKASHKFSVRSFRMRKASHSALQLLDYLAALLLTDDINNEVMCFSNNLTKQV